jgi:hypothetical protein
VRLKVLAACVGEAGATSAGIRAALIQLGQAIMITVRRADDDRTVLIFCSRLLTETVCLDMFTASDGYDSTPPRRTRPLTTRRMDLPGQCENSGFFDGFLPQVSQSCENRARFPD